MTMFAGMMGRLGGIGRMGMGAMGGPIGMGIMAATMMLPMMMGMGGQNRSEDRGRTALDRLSDELERVTEGFHRVNVEVRQLSDSVGQASTDTVQMSASFASIGRDNAVGAGMDLARQMALQSGQMQLGQVSQGALLGAGALGMDPGRMMGQSPAEQLRYIVDELRKLNETELESRRTLAALEMMLPGQSQDLMAMARLSEEQLRSQRSYEQAVERFMTGPRGQSLEAQSQALLAIAQRVSMRADLYERERGYLMSPFAEDRAERRERGAEWRMQMGMGWQEGLQEARVYIEGWSRAIHQALRDMVPEGTEGVLRQTGRFFGDLVSAIVSVGHGVSMGVAWIVNAINFLLRVVKTPLNLHDLGGHFEGIRQSARGLAFAEGTVTGDLLGAQRAGLETRTNRDARTSMAGQFGGRMASPRAGITPGAGVGQEMPGGGFVIEVRGKDDFANMMQYGIRTNTNRGRDVPGPRPDNAPSIAR